MIPPSATLSRAAAACSRVTVACALSKTTSPSGPAVVNRALAVLASTRDPAGSRTVTATAPELPRTRCPAGAVTRRVPSL